MRRTLRAAVTACMLLFATTMAVQAAQPTEAACLGQSVSEFAAAFGADFGLNAVKITALSTDHGVGDEVQLVQSGEFPDEAFPNTCNG